eukprot:gene5749-6043_t
MGGGGVDQEEEERTGEERLEEQAVLGVSCPGNSSKTSDRAARRLAGEPANPVYNLPRTADRAARRLTGEPANPAYDRSRTADEAARRLAGEPANPAHNRSRTSDTAARRLAGEPANPVYQLPRTTDRAARRLAGEPTNPAYDRSRTADEAARRLAGEPANPAHNLSRTVDRAARRLAGEPANPIYHLPRTVERIVERVVHTLECPRQLSAATFLEHVGSWNRLPRMLSLSTSRCAKFFDSMVCCAICGACHLGGPPSFHEYKSVPPDVRTPPPYALSFIYMESKTVDSDGNWWLCPACVSDKRKHAEHVIFYEPAYMTALLSTEPEDLLRLSVIDVHVSFSKRWMGFTTGSLEKMPMINAPVVSWGKDGESTPESLQLLLQYNLSTNPLLQAYTTMMERPGINGVPVLPQSAIQHIVQRHIARGPTAMEQQNPIPRIMSIVVDVEPIQVKQPGCREKGSCKFHFPMSTQPQFEPQFNVETKRYDYY